jgi:F0F1-type ATP synthase assembly protein I
VLPFSLGKVALEAEGLRRRHMAKRLVVRVVLGYFALGMVFGAVTFLHVAGWFWLRDYLRPAPVALIFTGIDLLLGLILGVLAVRSSPGRVEREALAIRRRALEDIAAQMTVSALAMQLVNRFIRSRRG